jgi:hypothetical protein
MLFLVEGVLTVFVAILALALLPCDVSQAWYLTKTERAHAVRRMEQDLQTFANESVHPALDYTLDHPNESNISGNNHSITWRDLQDVLKNWRKLLIIVCNILSVLVSLNALPIPARR